jgi:GDP-D-mannose dehydratase
LYGDSSAKKSLTGMTGSGRPGIYIALHLLKVCNEVVGCTNTSYRTEHVEEGAAVM